MSFADLGLMPELLKAVTDAGYTEPTPILDVWPCAGRGGDRTPGIRPAPRRALYFAAMASR